MTEAEAGVPNYFHLFYELHFSSIRTGRSGVYSPSNSEGPELLRSLYPLIFVFFVFYVVINCRF